MEIHRIVDVTKYKHEKLKLEYLNQLLVEKMRELILYARFIK
jgi:hypothetical protein